MNQYERILRVITDSTVPKGDPPLPSVYDNPEQKKHYEEGRPSRKKVKKKKKASRIRLRSKKTQAAYDRAEAKEAQAETAAFRSGGRGR